MPLQNPLLKNLRGILAIAIRYSRSNMSGICGGSSKAHWNALLTERSKKFYDGTYEWDGVDGYWDEQRGETGNRIHIIC